MLGPFFDKVGGYLVTFARSRKTESIQNEAEFFLNTYRPERPEHTAKLEK